MKPATVVLAAAALSALSGCTSVSSNYTADMKPVSSSLVVCHGFNCYNKTTLQLTAADESRFASIMARGKASPQAERSAVSAALQYFEDRAGQRIGIRDEPKSDLTQSGRMGQMDCIDESTNTRTLMLYLARRGLITHHTVGTNVSRGAFVDGRYPHSTAVLHEKAGGRQWAVDSWYEPMGGPPDIMPLSEWKSRGVMGER